MFGLFAMWMSYRTRIRGIDALRSYADRGQEPPAALLDTFRPGLPAPPRRQTRGEALSQAAFGVVMSAGAAGFAWWSQLHGGGPIMLGAILGAIVFAGIAVAMLVTAITARA